jgi:hypothetical protein
MSLYKPPGYAPAPHPTNRLIRLSIDVVRSYSPTDSPSSLSYRAALFVVDEPTLFPIN